LQKDWPKNEDFSFLTFDRLGFRVRLTVCNIQIEIKTVHSPNLSTYLKLSFKNGFNKAICRKIEPKMKIFYFNVTFDIYIIMWAVGLYVRKLLIQIKTAQTISNLDTNLKRLWTLRSLGAGVLNDSFCKLKFLSLWCTIAAFIFFGYSNMLLWSK
jgi:hypothetical protein